MTLPEKSRFSIRLPFRRCFGPSGVDDINLCRCNERLSWEVDNDNGLQAGVGRLTTRHINKD